MTFETFAYLFENFKKSNSIIHYANTLYVSNYRKTSLFTLIFQKKCAKNENVLGMRQHDM